MPIKESSFRIGCGRYVQEAGLLRRSGTEIARFGHAPLLVGGPTAWSLTRGTIEDSLKQADLIYRIWEHRGTCNDEDAKKLAELAKQEGFDVIVGVGGGVIMDFSKLIAHFASLPVVNIPTSSATCAAYTPLSVRYTPEGRTVGSLHYDHEVDSVLVDTEILAKQPNRLLLAGVFDALAKFIEIKHRFAGDASDYPLGLDWAYIMSVHSYRELCQSIETYLAKDNRDPRGDEIERMVFTLIAATGVISGIARGSNQTALAHKFYEATRVLFYEESRPYLHGEIVGIGLLLQNVFNGEEEENRLLFHLMKTYGMPCCLSDLGISPTEETVNAYYEALKNSSAVKEAGEGALDKLTKTLRYLRELG